MLVVSRKLRQRIVIGDDGEIVVEVLGMKGQSVRIGIQADKSVPVYREELVDVPTPASTLAEPEPKTAKPRTAGEVLVELLSRNIAEAESEPDSLLAFRTGYTRGLVDVATQLGVTLPEAP